MKTSEMGNIMTRKRIIIMILLSILITLSSCTQEKPVVEIVKVSEDVVRADIIKQFKIDETNIQLLDLTIDSNVINGFHDQVNGTLTIKTAIATLVLDVIVHYSYAENAWRYLSKEATQISSKPSVEPSDAEIEKAALELQYSLFSWDYLSGFDQILEMHQTERQVDFDKAKFRYTYQATYEMLDISSSVSMFIKADYVYEKGWQFSVDNYGLSETHDLTGTYKMTFQNVFEFEDKYFEPGQVLYFTLIGNIYMNLNKISPAQFANYSTGSIVLGGKSINLGISPSDDPNINEGFQSTHTLEIGSWDTEEIFFTIYVDTGLGRGGEIPPPSWVGVDVSGNYFSVKKIK
jgi:hypothetical protein